MRSITRQESREEDTNIDMQISMLCSLFTQPFSVYNRIHSHAQKKSNEFYSII